MPNKPMPAAERRRETQDSMPGPSAGVLGQPAGYQPWWLAREGADVGR